MSALHPQLQAVCDELEQANARLRSLAHDVPEQDWQRRPDPTRWSVAECVAHLNLTTRVYLPLLDDALAQARTLGAAAPHRYRRDLPGWLLWKILGPPARIRTKTVAAFVPTGNEPPSELIPQFQQLQNELLDRVRRAEGLPLGRVKIASPFDSRVKYNLYAALTILPRHQHRHLWQAEQVALAMGSARG